MTVMQLYLNEQTTEQIRRVAARRKAKPETLIQELVERLVATVAGESSLLGMLAQEPELINEIARDFAMPRQATVDPILALGTAPVVVDVADAAENHDKYLHHFTQAGFMSEPL